MLNISMLFAHWKAFGEKWSTPEASEIELRSRGHNVDVYNLYHENGLLNPRTKERRYSYEGFNQLAADIRAGKPCDMIYVLDYGPDQNPFITKQGFPQQILVKEWG